MLAGRSRDEIEALYRAREPYYRQADLTVDTTGINPDQVVAKLLLALRQPGEAST
jgi:shikimate kinase